MEKRMEMEKNIMKIIKLNLLENIYMEKNGVDKDMIIKII